MNWDVIEGKWKQFAGSARTRWGKLTDSDWDVIGGRKDKLIGHLQERYGWDKDQADREADEWSRSVQDEVHTR